MSSYVPRTPNISQVPSLPAPFLTDPSPQRINSRKFHEVRIRLHKYHVAVQLEGLAAPPSVTSSSALQSSQDTRSSASRTYPRAQSESSLATNLTAHTAVFSLTSGSEVVESDTISLGAAARARKSLIRYLGGCSHNCKRRKVKVRHDWPSSFISQDKY